MIPNKNKATRGTRLGQDPRRNGTKLSEAEVKKQSAEIESEITRLAGATRNIAFCDAVTLVEKKIKASPFEVRYGIGNLKLVEDLVKEAKSVRNTATTTTTTTTTRPSTTTTTTTTTRPTTTTTTTTTRPTPRPTYTPTPRPTYTPTRSRYSGEFFLGTWMIVALALLGLSIIGTVVFSIIDYGSDAFLCFLGFSVGGFILFASICAAVRGYDGNLGYGYPDWYDWYNQHVSIIIPVTSMVATITLFAFGLAPAGIITLVLTLPASFVSSLPDDDYYRADGKDYAYTLTYVLAIIGAVCIGIFTDEPSLIWIGFIVAAVILVVLSLMQQANNSAMKEEWYFPFLYLPALFFAASGFADYADGYDEAIMTIGFAVVLALVAAAINTKLLLVTDETYTAETVYNLSPYIVGIGGFVANLTLVILGVVFEMFELNILATVTIIGTAISSSITLAGEKGDAISATSVIFSVFLGIANMSFLAEYAEDGWILFWAAVVGMLFFIYAAWRINGMVEGDVDNSELFGFDFYYHGNDALLIFGIIIDVAMGVLIWFWPVLIYAALPVSLVILGHSALFLINEDLEADEDIQPASLSVSVVAALVFFFAIFFL